MCNPNELTKCEYARKLINFGAYYSYVQKRLVQAQYWHNPYNEKGYKKGSTFLAEINQEKVKSHEQIIDYLIACQINLLINNVCLFV